MRRSKGNGINRNCPPQGRGPHFCLRGLVGPIVHRGPSSSVVIVVVAVVTAAAAVRGRSEYHNVYKMPCPSHSSREAVSDRAGCRKTMLSTNCRAPLTPPGKQCRTTRANKYRITYKVSCPSNPPKKTWRTKRAIGTPYY